jgi:DNA-binding helix-hairpin-helix protein with protein kinase domain
MNEFELYSQDVSIPPRISTENAVHSGGEAEIFFTIDGNYAIKIYHANRVKPETRQLLEAIRKLGSRLTQEEKQFLCWPLALVTSMNGQPRVGCLMRRIPNNYKPLSYFNYSARTAVSHFDGVFSWSHCLQIARGVGRAVAVLHGRGCAHTDLSNNNFMVNSDNNSVDVVLLDLDGIVVPGFLPAQMQGTPGIIAPEIIETKSHPNEKTDRHSLAVQILQTLLFRNVFQPLKTADPDNVDNDEVLSWGQQAVFSEHPTDTRNRPRNLGIPLAKNGVLSYRMMTILLQKLTESACIYGLHDPKKRPSAKEWIDALSCSLDELYQCSNCRNYFPYPHWLEKQYRYCSFCGQRIDGIGPAVLALYEPRGRGKYIYVNRQLVLMNKWRIFADQIDSRRLPPLTRKGEPTIGTIEWDDKHKRYRLLNEEHTIWRVRISGAQSEIAVSPGDSVPLEKYTILNFGEDRRLLFVKE